MEQIETIKSAEFLSASKNRILNTRNRLTNGFVERQFFVLLSIVRNSFCRSNFLTPYRSSEIRFVGSQCFLTSYIARIDTLKSWNGLKKRPHISTRLILKYFDSERFIGFCFANQHNVIDKRHLTQTIAAPQNLERRESLVNGSR